MTKLTKSEIIKMRIKRIEKEIRDTPYHKGTEHHIGRLKAKLSVLKGQMEVSEQKSGGGGGYAIKKQGDATIILIGPPSVGKSTLLNKLTNAKSKIAPYAFTTLTVIPGMMKYKDTDIQILDVPGIIAGAHEGRGRGREVLSVARSSDLVLILTDIGHLKTIAKINKSLYDNGLRLDSVRPNVTIAKKLKGGVVIHSNIKQDLSNETIRSVASEFGFKNAELTIREKLSMETLVDIFAKNRVYVPSLVVVNKVDLSKSKSLNPNYLFISADKGLGLDELREAIWLKLNFIRVYLVRKDEDPSFDNPLVVKRGVSLIEVASKLGTEFIENKTRAKIWGNGAKFPGQEVSLSKEAVEGMQVRFI